MLKAIGNLIFPRDHICMICKERNVEVKDYICKTCSANLDIVDKEIDFDSAYIEKIYFSLSYNRFIRDVMKAYKFNGKNYLYRPLGQIMINSFNNMGIDIDKIAYIPMHRKKEAIRGYNQAELLAGYMAKKLDKPLIQDLVKIKATEGQSHLNKIERINNLRDSFKIKTNKSIRSMKILLVDDIITTGMTMNEASRILKEAGAKEIIGLALTSSKTK